jgi:hypothetical protein
VERARADERVDLHVRDVEAAERLLAKITRSKLEEVKLMVTRLSAYWKDEMGGGAAMGSDLWSHVVRPMSSAQVCGNMS